MATVIPAPSARVVARPAALQHRGSAWRPLGWLLLISAGTFGCAACSRPPEGPIHDAGLDAADGAADGGPIDGSGIDGSLSCHDDAALTASADLRPTTQTAAVLTRSGEVAVPPPALPLTVSPPIIPYDPWLNPAAAAVVPNAQCLRATRFVSVAMVSAETSDVRQVEADFAGRALTLLEPNGTRIVETAHSGGARISFYKPLFSLADVPARSGTLTLRAFDGDHVLRGTVTIPGFTVVAPPAPITTCRLAGMVHPRAWLTAERLASVRGRAPDDAALRRYEEAVGRFLDALREIPDPTTTAFADLLPDPESYVPALALCYQIERGRNEERAARCADAALALGDRIASDHLSGRRTFADQGGSAIRSDLVNLMLTYDWAYDRLTAAQRAAYADLGTQWIDWYGAHGPDRARPYTANYAGYLHAAALVAVAIAGESPQDGHVVGVLNDELAWRMPVLNQRLCGGDWPEGWDRGLLAIRQLQLVNHLLKDVGADHSILFDWTEAVPTWLTYGMAPDFRMLVPFGATRGSSAHRTSPALLAVLSSTTTEGDLAARLYVNALETPGNDLRDPSPGDTTWEMVFADTTSIGDPSTLALSYTATGTGRWISRSSFADPDGYQVVGEGMSYQGAGFGYANGDVRLYRGSECLLCPAAYRGPRFRGTDTTRAFSTYMVNQFPQGLLARNAHVVWTQASPELAGVAFRFGSSYAEGEFDEDVVADGNPLHYLVRQVVHLRPGTLIVRDMHFRRHPEDTMDALWHFGSTAERAPINDHSFTIPTSAGDLRVDSFTDFGAGMPAPTDFEVDFDETGTPIGTLMTERYRNDGSVRAMDPAQTPQEYTTFHVFSQEPGDAGVMINGGLTPAGVSWRLTLASGRCVNFERGGEVRLAPCS